MKLGSGEDPERFDAALDPTFCVDADPDPNFTSIGRNKISSKPTHFSKV